MHERWPLALLLVSVVTTASKTFIPTSRDVLLTVSFNSMGGNGLSHAFVFNRLDEAERDTGLLIDNTGRIANVGNEDWIALQQLVSDAKSTVADSGRKSDTWSRSEVLVLPEHSTALDLPMTRAPYMYHFFLTGHGISEDQPEHILHDGSIVDEIPSSIVEVETASFAVRKRLLPAASSRGDPSPSKDIRDMLNAITALSGFPVDDRPWDEEERRLRYASADEL